MKYEVHWQFVNQCVFITSSWSIYTHHFVRLSQISYMGELHATTSATMASSAPGRLLHTNGPRNSYLPSTIQNVRSRETLKMVIMITDGVTLIIAFPKICLIYVHYDSTKVVTIIILYYAYIIIITLWLSVQCCSMLGGSLSSAVVFLWIYGI